MTDLLRARIVLIFIALLLTSCAVQQTPIHPGSFNAFDSNAYDTILTAQAAILAAKNQIVSFPELKPALNNAIAVYNITQSAYKTYRAAGVVDTKAQAELSRQLTELISKVALLVAAQGVRP